MDEPRFTNIPYLTAVRKIVEAMRFVKDCEVSTKEEMDVEYQAELTELASVLRAAVEAGMTHDEVLVASKWGGEDIEWVLASY